MAGDDLRCILPVLALFLAARGEILFTDDFSDGSDDGWTHLGAAEFQVISQQYFIYSQGDRGQGTSLNGDQGGIMSTADYSVLCTVNIEAGLQTGLVCRYCGPSQWYYRLVLKPNSDTVALERRNDTGPTLVMDQAGWSIEAGTPYFVRLQVEGDLVRGRVWTGTPEDEPEEWLVSSIDGLQGNPGSFGVFGAGYGKVSWSMIFDDVVVTTPIPDGLHPYTWAGIKTGVF